MAVSLKRFAARPDRSVGSAQFARARFCWRKRRSGAEERPPLIGEAARHLAARYPDIKVLSDPIFVARRRNLDFGRRTAGIDMALALVEEALRTGALPARIARNLVVYLAQARWSGRMFSANHWLCNRRVKSRRLWEIDGVGGFVIEPSMDNR